VSDWVVFNDGGRINEQGAAADVLDRPREARTVAYVARYAPPG
jgi:polar amino acid transport system ATP-binding protein